MKRDFLLLLAIVSVLGLVATGFPVAPVQAKSAKVDVAKIHGRIQFVTNFPDFKVKSVEAFPDLKVEIVESFPDKPGQWQIVDSFPDYKIQLVDSFPDFTIQYVKSFPGKGK